MTFGLVFWIIMLLWLLYGLLGLVPAESQLAVG